MELDYVVKVVEQLALGNIPFCVVGELALNYYNVPRAVHDIEICVPANHLPEAVDILQTNCRLMKISNVPKEDIFTDYKKKFPRFASQEGPNIQLTLLLDEVYGFQCLENTIIPDDRQHSDSYYSKEILDVLSPDAIASLPFPSLGAFLGGLCSRYIKSRDVVYAMAAEQLVDGMDIDTAWCHVHLAHLPPVEQKFASDLVAGKRGRMDDFSENKITCYVVDIQDSTNIRRIPGSGFSELPEHGNGRRLMECNVSTLATQDVSEGGLDQTRPTLAPRHPTEGSEPKQQEPPEELFDDQNSPASSWSL
ncbi:hypothetical protein EPUS_02070 [Endocarpon pusillum Z07020]|uniref:Uncharacterized protein n=1 Tax=Endocarpon pusillum (strain Z07020 / HMAS-L-300199) TaxID=1263415 RepID=U1GPX4_ENDPU|nr:uncharacterized protein EPUS_02070 [Endocarpon pusillum Z07020]ERF74383.1 hypothetical protein EPUS_02070 [Endocarpon pusillum Z07020]